MTDKDKDGTKAPAHTPEQYTQARTNISELGKKRAHAQAQRKLRGKDTGGVKSGN